jgi:hypothetical protein
MTTFDEATTARLNMLLEALSLDRNGQTLMEKRMNHQDEALDLIGRDVQAVVAILSEAFPRVRANLASRERRGPETTHLVLEPLPERRP